MNMTYFRYRLSIHGKRSELTRYVSLENKELFHHIDVFINIYSCEEFNELEFQLNILFSNIHLDLKLLGKIDN